MQQTYLSWGNIEELVSKVVKDIAANGKKYDWIIGINRGGLVPSVLMSHRLGVPHGVLTVTHYEGKKMLAEVKRDLYLSGIKFIKPHHNILLVDDIADSGICLKEAQQTLKRLDSDAKNIDTVTLHYKEKSEIVPTYYGIIAKENEWINYPWEATVALNAVGV
jgi:hypoxanthine phosphoribosyltransferase